MRNTALPRRAARRVSSCTITVTDGIAMGHQGMKASLVSREVHRGFHRTDHAWPLLRRDGGPCGLRQISARHDDGHGAVSTSRVSSSMAARSCPAGSRATMSRSSTCSRPLGNTRRTICPTKTCTSLNRRRAHAGSCGGQFTANTMACVSEAIGLALPGSAGTPAPYESRDRFAYESGRAVMQLIAQNIRPRDIVTRKALENAATVVAASGGSTNAALHLPAIAHDAGIEFDLFDVAEIFKQDALHRGSETGRSVRGEGHVRGGWNAGPAQNVARRRLSAWGLHHRDREDARRESGRRGVSDGSGGYPACQTIRLSQNRRCRRSEGERWRPRVRS